MQKLSILGIILIAFGVISLAYAGISYTRHEEIAKIGSLTAEADVKHTIPVSPPIAGVAIAAGIACIIAAGNKRAV